MKLMISTSAPLTAKSKVAQAFISWCEGQKLAPGYKSSLKLPQSRPGMYWQYNGVSEDLTGLLEALGSNISSITKRKSINTVFVDFQTNDGGFLSGMLCLNPKLKTASLWLYK